MGDGWIRPAQVKLVAEAVLKACDKADGVADLVVEDAVGCKATFKPETLRCTEGQNADQCLTDAQINAINTLHAPYKFSFTMANGLDDYPGWGVSGEDTPSFGPTGGWMAWWLGKSAPAQPPAPTNGIAWIYGAGGIQYVFARDPKLDVTKYKPEDHKDRVLAVSALMDSTDPDLSRFRARGGRLIMLEHMADYAQSPYAGIRYFERVQQKLGKADTAEFARLYTAPGVDHVGSGAPANIDMLSVLVDWVEKGHAPGDLEVAEQKVEPPAFATVRALPLCQWPAWPHYKSGPAHLASSFTCAP
jgi:feruloyl esterase